MQFSLRWLFGIVLYAAIGCALLPSSDGWVAALCDFAFVALCFMALLGSIYTRHGQRAFWIGCAIVACSFLVSYFASVGYHTPRTVVWNLFSRLGYRHRAGPLWSAGVEAFFAIGCSIAGGVLARWFQGRSANEKS